MKLIIGSIVVVTFLSIFFITGSHVVPPGHRGVRVTFGTTSAEAVGEGYSLSNPFSTIEDVSVRQQTSEMTAECFSSDLQQVKTKLKVIFRVPENSVVNIFKNYQGKLVDSFVAPRVQEAVKEVTATRSAERIVKEREQIKSASFQLLRAKLSGLVEIDDLVIENVDLSDQLEHAIEQKMVQEQEAAKAKFTQQKAEIDAKTAIIRAEGEAQAIKIRGAALRENPALVQLQLVEKWDGKAPMYVGGGANGAGMILPVGK